MLVPRRPAAHGGRVGLQAPRHRRRTWLRWNGHRCRALRRRQRSAVQRGYRRGACFCWGDEQLLERGRWTLWLSGFWLTRCTLCGRLCGRWCALLGEWQRGQQRTHLGTGEHRNHAALVDERLVEASDERRCSLGVHALKPDGE